MARQTAAEKKAAEAVAAQAGGVAPAETPAQASAPKGFAWAVNRAKLARAIAWVKENKKGVTGQEYEDEIKARYELLGGLVGNSKTTGGKPAGSVVNMAEDNVGEDEE